MATKTQTTEEPPVDEEKLNELLGTVVTDFGATWYAPLVVIGDTLGLYETLAARDRFRLRNWPVAPILPSATCVSGSPRGRLVGT